MYYVLYIYAQITHLIIQDQSHCAYMSTKTEVLLTQLDPGTGTESAWL